VSATYTRVSWPFMPLHMCDADTFVALQSLGIRTICWASEVEEVAKENKRIVTEYIAAQTKLLSQSL
jgi:hypothetical protein